MSPIKFLEIFLNNWGLFLLIFSLVSIFFFGISKIIFKKYINGMVYVQSTSIIVFSIVFLLFFTDEISFRSLWVFIGSEILILCLMFFAYKNLLTRISSINIINKLNRLNKYLPFFLFCMTIVILYDFYMFYNLNLEYSRLSHKVNLAYSFIRIIKNFFLPVLYILLFHNFYLNNKIKSFLIFTFLVLTSIFSGSKSGFIIILFISFFIYKDLTQIKSIFKSNMSVFYFITYSLSVAIINITLMGVDFDILIIRIIDFAEAPIMTLPIDNPAETIFKNNSYFSVVHRSLGKLFGDVSSFDISSLFGFRLHEYFYGSNTLVGPNARIGAMFYSFFERQLIILTILIISIIIYLASRFHSLFKYSNFIHFSYILILINTYQDLVLDYNKAISNFSTIIALFLFSTLNLILKKSYVKTIK